MVEQPWSPHNNKLKAISTTKLKTELPKYASDCIISRLPLFYEGKLSDPLYGSLFNDPLILKILGSSLNQIKNLWSILNIIACVIQ